MLFRWVPLAILVKAPSFSPSWAHFPLHGQKLLFQDFPTFLRRVPPSSFGPTPVPFPFMGWWISRLFWWLPPSFFFARIQQCFAFMATKFPFIKHKLRFSWFCSLFGRVRPSSFRQNLYFHLHGHILCLHEQKLPLNDFPAFFRRVINSKRFCSKKPYFSSSWAQPFLFMIFQVFLVGNPLAASAKSPSFSPLRKLLFPDFPVFFRGAPPISLGQKP